MGDTVIGYSAQNHHRWTPRPLKWNPEAENDLVSLRVHRAVFHKLKISQSEIAGKVGGPKIAGGGKLLKASGILPIVVRRVIFNGREQGGHGINGVRLSQYELVFRRHLIGGLRLCRNLGKQFPILLPESGQFIGLLSKHSDFAAEPQQFIELIARQ
jgi:hypothetical protein